MTKEEATIIEQKHNVYVDAETEQYTIGEREDTYGWDPIPEEWLEDLK